MLYFRCARGHYQSPQVVGDAFSKKPAVSHGARQQVTSLCRPQSRGWDHPESNVIIKITVQLSMRFTSQKAACFFFFLSFFFFFLRFYLFIREREREREREAETQAGGEAGSMQGARCGTRSLVSRISPWAKDRCSTAEPPRCSWF
ncbi:hypothetical protein VULLAG_LOCUS13311 [Vulpes lagopus]